MPLMTAAAAILTIVGMAAAVSKTACSPVLALTSMGSGTIMLAVLMVPGLSNFTAAALTLALLVPVLGAWLLTKMRPKRPPADRHRIAFVLPVVDIGFMALALLLMPAHGSAQSPAAAATVGAGHSHGSHMTMGPEIMGVVALIGWTMCALILAAPAMRRRSFETLPHAVCSACMILAMTVMAL